MTFDLSRAATLEASYYLANVSGTGFPFATYRLIDPNNIQVNGRVVGSGAGVLRFNLTPGRWSWGVQGMDGASVGSFGTPVAAAAGTSQSWNMLLTPSAVPEPDTWAMLIAGFGLTGAAMRRRRAVIA